MADWIDNADSYRCPVCGYETGNPNNHNCKCPVCGFTADKDMLGKEYDLDRLRKRGSGEYLYNEDGNRNRYCGQCGQRIDWTNEEE